MKMYNAAVEVATKKIGDVDELMDALEPYSGAIGTSPRGWLEARISIPGVSVAQAAGTACAIVEQATGVITVAVEVMTEDEFAAREGFTPEPDIVNALEAASILGVSATRVRQFAADGRLQEVPVAGDTAGRIKVFTRSSVEALANQARRGGRPRKATADTTKQEV